MLSMGEGDVSMKNNFSGTFPKPPEMGLRARLGWEDFTVKVQEAYHG